VGTKLIFAGTSLGQSQYVADRCAAGYNMGLPGGDALRRIMLASDCLYGVQPINNLSQDRSIPDLLSRTSRRKLLSLIHVLSCMFLVRSMNQNMC
jgi:hypothetical protein